MYFYFRIKYLLKSFRKRIWFRVFNREILSLLGYRKMDCIELFIEGLIESLLVIKYV